MTDPHGSFKVIIPKKLQIQSMLNVLVNEAEKQGKEMVKDFNGTTHTWKGDKPEFRATMKIDPPNAPSMGQFPKQIVLTIAPRNDNSRGARKWQYLNKGTPYPRHALMTKGFIPKTKSGFLGSEPGHGGLLIVSKKIKLPGIKARKWDKALSKKWAKLYAEAMKKAMHPAVQASGHDIGFYRDYNPGF